MTTAASALFSRVVRAHSDNGILGALDESLGYGSPVKAEINYNMTKSPPEPIMNRQNSLKATECLSNRTKEIPGFERGTGMVRRPDAVVVRDPHAPPTQANLLEVVEIKFPGDRYDEAQMRAYGMIAGDNAKVIELSPEKCCCDDSKKQPVSQAKKETASKLELLLLCKRPAHPPSIADLRWPYSSFQNGDLGWRIQNERPCGRGA